MAGSEQGGRVTFGGLRFARSLGLAFLWVLLLPAAAEGQFLVATNSDGSLTITGYTGPGGTVTIPATINGLPVKTIGSYVFFENTSLTSVIIGTNVISIGPFAFCSCTSLTNVSIPNSVTSISDDAFGNTGLNSITIPANVTSIGDYAFTSFALRALYFLGNPPSLGVDVFWGDDASVYYLSGAKGWGATYGGLPSSLWHPPVPCAYTTNNGSVTITQYLGSSGWASIPSSIDGLPVTSIASNAFANFSSLSSVTISGSVTNIASGAFASCTNLAGVYVEGNAPTADSSVFSGDFNPIVYYLPGTTGWGVAFGGRRASLFPFVCSSNNGIVAVTGYTGTGGVVSIPGTINSLRVADIGEYAFSGSKLTSVTIPNTVTNMGSGAFAVCATLVNVTIPNSLTNVADFAFYGCSRLASFAIPDSVTDIGNGVFDSCTSLPSIVIPNSVTNIGDFSFSSCTNLTGVTIDTNVKSMGDSAFSACSSLSSITIPASVTSIGSGAFSSCSNLAGAYFEGNNPLGDSSLFTGDNNATVFYMPGTTGWGPVFGDRPTAPFPFTFTVNSGVVTITGYAGAGGDVSIPALVSDLPVTVIGQFAFSGSSVAILTIPNTVTNIGRGAFSYCTTLNNISIPNSITNIGINMLEGCDSLTNVAIPNGVTGIGIDAFGDCTGLTSVTMGNRVTNIGDFAFYDCSSLASLTIPNSVTNIGDFAFYGCASLSSIYFQGNAPGADSTVFTGDDNATVYFLAGTAGWGTTFGGVATAPFPFTYIVNPPINNHTAIITGYTGASGNVNIPGTVLYGGANVPVTAIAGNPGALGAFSGCTWITNVTIPNTVTNLGLGAFYYCTNLPSITIGNRVTSIEAFAFEGCYRLTSIAIPAGVTNIGFEAFRACTSLTAITVDPNNPNYTSVAGVLFDKGQTTLMQYPVSSTRKFYAIPNTVTDIGSFAFTSCASLTGVTIPNSLANIEAYAFAGCPSLTGIYFSGNAPSQGANVFIGDNNSTVYYLPGTTGWGPTFGGLPTSPWLPQMQTSDGSFGVRSNQFGFNVTWASGQTVVVQAATNLANPVWQPVATNTLSNGSLYFIDPQWTNYPARFYRVTTP